MLEIICAKYGKNSSKSVCAVKRKQKDVPYFSSFITKSRLNDLEDKGQGQRAFHATHPLMLVIICAQYGMNPSRTLCAVHQTQQDELYFSSFCFFAKSWLNDLQDKGQGQRSLYAAHPLTNDHLCLIWKESIQNCRSYRADTEYETDGQTDGRSETKISPTTLLCGGYGYVYHIDIKHQQSQYVITMTYWQSIRSTS